MSYAIDRVNELARTPHLPPLHINHLQRLKESGFEPKVIYDIGANVLHWTNEAKKLWADAEYVLFDAYEIASFLYKDYKHHIGVLSDEDGKEVKFYTSETWPGGNSYYCENTAAFSKDRYTAYITSKLDTIVKEKNLPLPDLVKIDVQGAEKDVIIGGLNTISHASRLIVEMQSKNYNDGAPKVDITLPFIESLGWKCTDPAFCNNGPDADYGFMRLSSESQ